MIAPCFNCEESAPNKCVFHGGPTCWGPGDDYDFNGIELSAVIEDIMIKSEECEMNNEKRKDV